MALGRPREGPSLPAVFLLPSAGTPCGPSQGQLFRTDSGIVLAQELENLLGRIVSIELLKGLSLPVAFFFISFGYKEGYKGRILIQFLASAPIVPKQPGSALPPARYFSGASEGRPQCSLRIMYETHCKDGKTETRVV